MPINFQNLIEGQPAPVTVTASEPILKALRLMTDNELQQLPVVDLSGKFAGLISNASILQALRNLGVTLDQLHVIYAIYQPRKYRLDDDFDDLLGELRRNPAVPIIDNNGRLTGIVTTYDTTEYFRSRAQDMMLIEDIELALRDHIVAVHSDSSGKLDEPSLEATMRAALPSVRNPDFGKLTLFNYIELIVNDQQWQRYSVVFDIPRENLKRKLHEIREVRNVLAHFRQEITPEQRDQLEFWRNWLKWHPTPSPNGNLVAQTALIAGETLAREAVLDAGAKQPSEIVPIEDSVSPSESRYAPLALMLQNAPDNQDNIALTFEQIETIIGSQLPPSARQHRSWWANDSVGHVQSQQWLNVGWRVSSINMSDEVITFSRTADRQNAYIRFYSKVLDDLRDVATFQRKNTSPIGVNWLNIVSIKHNTHEQGIIGYAFTQSKQFRVELYIDTGYQEKNKLAFDKLQAQQAEIEAEMGHSLSWERIDNKRASRIALYYDKNVSIKSDEAT